MQADRTSRNPVTRRLNGSGQAANEVVSEQADRVSVDLADPRLG